MPTTNENTVIEFTPEAVQTITKMRDRVTLIRHAFGPESFYHYEAAASLARSLTQIVGLGGRVMRDGELSLICVNDHITYGVNFHTTPVDDPEVDAEYRSLPGEWSVNS